MKTEIEQLKAERDELVELISSEREAVARFLVPYRDTLPESWLDHFSDSCGVYFDSIGFVYPRPIVLKCNNPTSQQSEPHKPEASPQPARATVV